MKSRNSYKTNVYYFAINSMIRNYANKEKCSKRAKKQFDFIRDFIDSKDTEKLAESFKGEKNGRNI